MLPFQLSNPSMSLLYVEDEPSTREIISKSLRLGFPSLNLYYAENGEDGLQQYRKYRPDVILTDINMPEMDGIRMAQNILAEDPDARIIVLSCHSDLLYLLDAIKIGVKRYVMKPLDQNILFETITECLTYVTLERQLRRQEQYIRMLSKVVEQNSSLVAITDSKGDIEYANSNCSEFNGYSPETIVGRNLRHLHAAGADFDEIWNIVSAGKEWRGESINLKKNEETYWEAASITPFFDSEGSISHFVTIREDITMKRRRQDEMDRVQKLESLGVLAGGIAHDFNNILTGILGNISFAQTMISEADKLKGPLEEAEKASYRAAELTRRLLTFARGGKPVKKQVSVRHLVDEVLSLALSGSNVEGVVNIADGVHAMEVDAGQIHQAFNNILINAMQAMSDGGTIIISAENVTVDPTNEIGLAPGHFLKISFADEGSGIPAENQKKIFDPYFSTKPGGSGLGLASTHSIITQHGGSICVESSHGRGATFICHLPSTGKLFSECLQKPKKQAQVAAAGGRVLLMDDESMVRKVTGKMLESLGYRVTTCINGEEAIACFKKGAESLGSFLAVIMDLTVVGGMGGKDAAQHILAMDPHARLVVSSGYFDDPVLADYKTYGFCAIMQKPYKLSDLADLMTELYTTAAAPEGGALL